MKNIKRMSYGYGMNPTYKELCNDVQKHLIEQNKCFIELKLDTLNVGVDAE